MPRVGEAAEAVQFENGLSCVGCLPPAGRRGCGAPDRLDPGSLGACVAYLVAGLAWPVWLSRAKQPAVPSSQCRDLIFVIVLGVLRSRVPLVGLGAP